MLKLKNIVKHYVTPGMTVEALKGVSIDFRKSEFVSILGPSGCGKTTLLNIIGGLDRYTSGDLFINNRSTKDFTDRDWDSYRNISVGFVFQNYNLIPHQTVLSNVELALTLSGVSKQERRRRAIEALEKVGLHDQINKRPNQLSGGQMQRVAIARAIVNDPEILLADEPTGALDTKTSVQILDILKEISKERLVIMVTHNAELAERYSSRIISLRDGEVISDTNPPTKEELVSKKEEKYTLIKTAMSFMTAMMLSLKNLISKKGRTILTALAGSIGIIGIALVLSISNGFDKYIKRIQSDTLSGYPLTIKKDVTFAPESINRDFQRDQFPDKSVVKVRDYSRITHTNIIGRDYLTFLEGLDQNLYNSISYTRHLDFNIIVKDNQNDDYFKLNIGENISFPGGFEIVNRTMSELIDNYDLIKSQYDIIEGRMPEEAGDLVLIVDSFNRIDVNLFEALGIELLDGEREVSFDKFLNLDMRLVLNDDFYQLNPEKNTFIKKSPSKDLFELENNIPLRIVGILRVKPEIDISLFSDGLYYTPALTELFLNDAKDSQIVKAQKEAGYTRNVLEGDQQIVRDEETYTRLMRRLGGDDMPNAINIYPKDFESKEKIKEYLNTYNEGRSDEDRVIVEDLSEIVTKTLSTLINTISYVLVAFAAISLVVSSIMIGIITYVSVIERTKEIGVLRSIGARKRDISRVFNAETIIIGFTAGTIGVIIAYILTIPINLIINSLVENVNNISKLNPIHAIFLVTISMILTLISGLIPSRIAANKDPVVALRTE